MATPASHMIRALQVGCFAAWLRRRISGYYRAPSAPLGWMEEQVGSYILVMRASESYKRSQRSLKTHFPFPQNHRAARSFVPSATETAWLAGCCCAAARSLVGCMETTLAGKCQRKKKMSVGGQTHREANWRRSKLLQNAPDITT